MAMEQPVIDSDEFLTSDDDIRTIVCDAMFNALKAHFLAQGKGRRPKIPSFDVPTNRIVAQLFFLKKANDVNWEKMAEWYNKLFQAVTCGRLRHQTEKILAECKKCSISLLANYLDQTSSLAFPLDPCLSSIGLTHHILLDDSPTFSANPDIVVTNAMIRALEDFRLHHKLPVAFTLRNLRLLLSSSSLASKTDAQLLYCVTKVRETLRKNGKAKGLQQQTENYLLQPIFSSINSPDPASKGCLCSSELTIVKKQQKTLGDRNCVLEENCAKQNLIIDTLKTERDVLRASLEELTALKSLNKTLHAENLKLRADLEESQLIRTRCYRNNSILRKQNRILQDADTRNCAQFTEIQSLKRQLTSVQKQKHKIKKKFANQTMLNQSMQELLNSEKQEIKTDELKVPGTNRFKDFVRLCYVELQGEGNVAAVNCSKVVDIVSRHFFDKDFGGTLPGKSSALTFAAEGHLLAKQHVMDSILESEFFTFSCDGTSRQKKHYLEQHITLNSGKVLSLGFSEIACDDSDTLLESCISSFKDISCVDALEEKESTDPDSSLKDIIGKLKCLMSDRASVMKAFDTKVANFKNELLQDDSSTHFLFCSAHFLIGLGSETENALKSLEHEVVHDNAGVRLGRDANPIFKRFDSDTTSSVSRLIRLSAEVCGPRGDEKNGCREEWLAYCSSIGECRSEFTSYRSNRFNCLFENATAILHHREDLDRFLSNFASHSNLKLQSILEDLRDDTIMSILSALSLFHVVFTGPYWKLMNSSTPYGHFPRYVRKMESCLQSWSNDAPPPSEPIFPEFSISTPVSPITDPFIVRSFRAISAYCLVVLRRQLCDFLEGGVFGGEIPADLQMILDSCPLTNLVGERLFGHLDYDMGKRRRASIFLRSTLSMWKMNKTSRWIHKQSNYRIRKLVSRAIHHAPKWRALSRQKQLDVREKVKCRIVANKTKKMAKDIQLAELKSATMDIILSQGGVCTTREGLDRLFRGPKPLDNLKAQIRYRRLFRGEKILLSGKTKDLYERLLQRI